MVKMVRTVKIDKDWEREIDQHEPVYVVNDIGQYLFFCGSGDTLKWSYKIKSLIPYYQARQIVNSNYRKWFKSGTWKIVRVKDPSENPIEDHREEFEEWAKGMGMITEKSYSVNGDIWYTLLTTDNAWKAWLASKGIK